MIPASHLRDARWYAHRFVETADTFRLVKCNEAELANATFLTDGAVGPRDAQMDVPCDDVLRDLANRAPMLVFHSAFCGSTLLVKALTASGRATGLSEPLMLNDLVGWRLRGAPTPALARVTDAALRLLAREFVAGRRVVVKPSNLVNPLAELCLALQPEAKAIFLYAPLESFLISVARKGIACRAWVRDLAAKYLTLGMFEPLGISASDAFLQTDLQLAASGWLAQHLLFSRLAERMGPGRLRTLNADRMTASPGAALERVGAHFNLGVSRALADTIAAGPVFARHSKSGAAFTPADRTTAYASALDAHGDEITTVMAWAGLLIDRAGVTIDLPGALL